MAFQLDVQVTLSILDRLTDNDPRVSVEAPPSRAEATRRLRASVRRDIEWLLNSRRIADAPDLALKEVNTSALVYGLPDISSVGLANPAEQNRLLAAIERSLRIFEPRLRDVKVVPVTGEKQYVQRLDFRIEAMLMLDPAPEPISFDTSLDSVSQSYKVKTEGIE